MHPIPDELAPSVVGGKVTDLAHVRRVLFDAALNHDLRASITSDSFGASGEVGAVDCTADLLDAIAWAAERPSARPIILTGGVYVLSDTLTLPQGVSIYGRHRETQLYFDTGGQDKDGIVLSGSGHNALKGFTIGGPASCGRHGIHLPQNHISRLDIDLDLYGGWLVGMYQADEVPAASGTLWSRIRLANLRWAVGAKPFDYFVNRSFINVCDVEIHAFGVTGTAIVLACNYDDGNYSAFSGSAEGCGQGFDVTGGTGVKFASWAEESNASRSVADKIRRLEISNSNAYAELVDCSDARISQLSNASIERSGYTRGLVLDNPPIVADTLAARPNSAEMSRGLPYYNAHGGAVSTPGYGESDPPNLLPNGDFERWIDGGPIGGSYVAGWTYSYLGTKCGDGCVDTTRTLLAPHCCRFEAPAGGAGFWGAFFNLSPYPLDPSLIDVPITLRLKAKRVSGTGALVMFFAHAGDLDGGKAGGDGAIVCESGFSVFTVSRLITSAFLEYRPLVSLYSTDPWYVSEVSVSIGYTCPRIWTPATHVLGVNHAWVEGRRVVEGCDAAPTGTNDPVYGTARQDGDIAINVAPAIAVDTNGNSSSITTWTRASGTWTPRVELAALNDLFAIVKGILGATLIEFWGEDYAYTEAGKVAFRRGGMGNLAINSHATNRFDAAQLYPARQLMGPGTASQDKALVCSTLGVGVIKSAWVVAECAAMAAIWETLVTDSTATVRIAIRSAGTANFDTAHGYTHTVDGAPTEAIPTSGFHIIASNNAAAAGVTTVAIGGLPGDVRSWPKRIGVVFLANAVPSAGNASALVAALRAYYPAIV